MSITETSLKLTFALSFPLKRNLINGQPTAAQQIFCGFAWDWWELTGHLQKLPSGSQAKTQSNGIKGFSFLYWHCTVTSRKSIQADFQEAKNTGQWKHVFSHRLETPEIQTPLNFCSQGNLCCKASWYHSQVWAKGWHLGGGWSLGSSTCLRRWQPGPVDPANAQDKGNYGRQGEVTSSCSFLLAPSCSRSIDVNEVWTGTFGCGAPGETAGG